MKEKSYLLLLAALLVLPLTTLRAQDDNEKGIKPSLGCDIVTSYIWRGIPSYTSLGENNVLAPNLQPYFSLNYKGLELGAWGSVDFTGTFKEIDYYLNYSLHGFKFTFTDYYWNVEWLKDNFFDYRNKSTSHLLEGALSYQGEKIPISIMVATMIYGDDKKYDDPEKNNFSTYIEAGYSVPVKEYTLDFFFGVTPMDGLYGDGYGGRKGFAVVNTGLSCSRDFKITEKFSLPVKASVIANPQAEKMYFVLSLSI